MNTLTHRKSLSEKQLDILRLLYRFRFGTTELFALALHVKGKHKINERLKILLDQEYIGRNYEAGYKLAGKHATYYLLPKGIKALRTHEKNCDSAVLHNLHKDKTASEQFIRHSLQLLKVHCDLASREGIKFFTKTQLTSFDYFPEPLPDAYIRVEDNEEERQYFIEILQSSRPFFTSVRKIKKHIAYAEDGEWDVTETALPTILLICDDLTLKRRVEKLLAKLEADIDEEIIFGLGLTAKEAIEHAESPDND